VSEFDFQHVASYWCSVVTIDDSALLFSYEHETNRQTDRQMTASLNVATGERVGRYIQMNEV